MTSMTIVDLVDLKLLTKTVKTKTYPCLFLKKIESIDDDTVTENPVSQLER